MIVAQLLLPGASEYECKSQRIDFASLSAEHDVRFGDLANAEVVHIYSPRELDPKTVRGIAAPYVSNARPKPRRFRKTVPPRHVVTPLKATNDTYVPEAVEDIYFSNRETQQPSNREAQQPGNRATIGTVSRPSIRNIVEQTAARMHRF